MVGVPHRPLLPSLPIPGAVWLQLRADCLQPPLGEALVERVDQCWQRKSVEPWNLFAGWHQRRQLLASFYYFRLSTDVDTVLTGRSAKERVLSGQFLRTKHLEWIISKYFRAETCLQTPICLALR